MTSAAAPAQTRPGELMTIADICRDLGRSRPWVQGVIEDPAEHFPAPITVGRREYYLRSKYRAWLDAKSATSQAA